MNDLIQRVGFPMFIQLVLESWNEIILLMLTAVMLIGKSKDRQNELINKTKIPLTNELIMFFAATFLYNLFDIIGRSTSDCPVFCLLQRTGVFFYYAVGNFLTLLFLQVVKKYVAEKNESRTLKIIISAFQLLCMFNYALLIITPFTGVIYSINELSQYSRSWGYYVWQGITIASFLIMAGILILQHRKIDRFLKSIVITASVVPVCGIIVGSL